MNLNLSPSFIEIYDKALSSKECNILISQFENHPKKTEGMVYTNGVRTFNRDVKDSLEIDDPSFSDPTIITSIISTSLNKCFAKYRKKHSTLNDQVFSRLKFDNLYTFKKFEGKNGGFKKWHCEHGMDDITSKRILVWSFYLNNCSGTDFMYYPNVSGKKGRCVIFPASFNYMHKSAPNKGVKYYVSGWISYA
tara:strand:- start:70 stop:648 length:579 start_codon:yes stop_codon:yes gene_type:complete